MAWNLATLANTGKHRLMGDFHIERVSRNIQSRKSNIGVVGGLIKRRVM